MSALQRVQLSLEYRPHQLSDVVGQRAVVDIISAMLLKYFDKGVPLPSGMLFCGSRGTGKTTMARILASILNCSFRPAPLVSCGKCSSCKQIAASNDTAVIELDAASSGLVGDIRKLKDIALTSHAGNFRVFVLDEVHGMSNSAFQALLKILEEPPSNTLFILATTEPHKILETIISRLMVFEFKRISEEAIANRLLYIAEKEGLAISSDAVKAIASYVDGGMRDAVMALDQLRYVTDDITVDIFDDYYGVVGPASYFNMVDCLANGRIVDGLSRLTEEYSRSSDAGQFVDGFSSFFKDLLLVKYGASDAFPELADHFSEQQLLSLINIAWDIRAKVRYTGLNNKTILDIMYVQFARALGTVASSPAAPSQKIDKDSLKSMFM